MSQVLKQVILFKKMFSGTFSDIYTLFVTLYRGGVTIITFFLVIME